MSKEKSLIKINSELTQSQTKEIISKIGAFEGVISPKIVDGVLSYDLSEWASDYDVLVEILNHLEEKGFDAEPLFVGAEKVSTEEENFEFDNEHEHDHEHESCHCHDCSDNGRSRFHAHSHDCSCENLGDKKERKYKFLELSAAIIIMILGVIFSSFEKTSKMADYVLIVAFAIAGYNAVLSGITSVFKKKPFNQNTLMTIASVAAIILGETLEAVGIMILFQVGELFEHSAVASADKVINDLKSFKNEKVSVIKEGGIEERVSPDKVAVGDIIVIREGERCALDGVIVSGSASFDTKIITGEVAYKDLTVGDNVLGGYLSANGSVKIEVSKTYGESAVNVVAKTIEESAKNKSKAEKFLDKFAKWYTPLVVVLALVVAFIFPIFSETYKLGLSVWGKRAVMVLCVSCPCSIIVSVPLAYFIGVATSAKVGVIVKNTLSLEQLSAVETVAFDKTGTLTEGELKVAKILSVKKYQGKVLSLVNACEKYSNHPIALAIRKKAGDSNLEITDYHSVAGKGVTCALNGDNLVVGNARFLMENGVKVTENEDSGIKVYLAVNGEYAGAVILSDVPRKNARGMIRELKDLGVYQTVILTGDDKMEATVIKDYLGVDKVRANLLPDEKVSRLEKIISKSVGTVAFVGDGVNDAPVLKRADVGITMGNGLDVSIDSADVVLTNCDLQKIPYVIKLAKRTKNIARQNVFGSLAIKIAIIALSMLGVTTSLWFAIASDVGLLVLAILNSLRNGKKSI